MTSQTEELENAIAVISVGGRFPGARDVAEFWDKLIRGVESISVLTDKELLDAGLSPETISQAQYVKATARLADHDMFDAGFFGYSRREAELLDPQQRIFLESAWELVEAAGYDVERCARRIGVFAGASESSYVLRHLERKPEPLETAGSLHVLALASSRDFLATRVAYKLNLTGPALTIQTACSTSLVAVHYACQSLLLGESEMAIAGGVSIVPEVSLGYMYQLGGILSPDGHCRAFDHRAQGTVSGQGVGLVLLKRLEDAIADGDTILSVIRGSAVNNDGMDKIGFTAPSIRGQTAVIRQAMSIANVNPETIGYVESHGTGTPLGDPIEVTALTRAFRTKTSKRGYCALGSLKSNIGHLDAAAGVAGLIKATLALKHRLIPPTLHFEKPNPELDLDESPFYVNSELQVWSTDKPRRAAVSAFGMGGTNAHVVLEEPPLRKASGLTRPWQLLILSARTPRALDSAADRLATHIRTQAEPCLGNVAYTLAIGRRLFEHRRVVVCRNAAEAVIALSEADSKNVSTGACEAGVRSVAFLIAGQSSQSLPIKGQELYQQEIEYRRVVDDCARVLVPILGVDLRDVLYPSTERSVEEFGQTSLLEPMLFVESYALAMQWKKWGVEPSALLGSGIGEYVAACLSGVFSWQEALTVLAHRAQLLQSSSSEASHLGREEGIKSAFAEHVRSVQVNAPIIPCVSSLTGTWMRADEAIDPSYWTRHLHSTLPLTQRVETLLEGSRHVLLEIGPWTELSDFVPQSVASARTPIVSVTKPFDSNGFSVPAMLKTLGQLVLLGVSIKWSEFFAAETRHRIPLPTYPFERKRYWVDAGSKAEGKSTQTAPVISSLSPRGFLTASWAEIELAVANAFGEVLGLGEDVRGTDDFFELGGDSLLALDLLARIELQLKVSLSPSLLVQSATIDGLTEAIAKTARTVQIPAHASLVELQRGRAKVPLFLAHPAGGAVYCYRALVEAMGTEFWVCGLEAQGLREDETPRGTIEELAQSYVEAIRTIQPKGPYFLGGSSMGGTIAFEMAQRILREGDSVAMLAMLDTPGPEQMPEPFASPAHRLLYLFGDAIPVTIEELCKIDGDKQIDFLMQRAATVVDSSTKIIEQWRLLFGASQSESTIRRLIKSADPTMRRLVRLFDANTQALRIYQPRPYSGRLHFFRAIERRPGDPTHPERAWVDLAEGGIQIDVVSGNHLTMLDPEHVTAIARRLRGRLIV